MAAWHGRWRGIMATGAALAVLLGTGGVAAAQAVIRDGSPALSRPGDQMEVGSQPALPSCAERPSVNNLGPSTGPITGYAPGTDALGSTGPGTTTNITQGPGPGALPVTGPVPATSGRSSVGGNPEAPPVVIGAPGPAVDNIGRCRGPGHGGGRFRRRGRADPRDLR